MQRLKSILKRRMDFIRKAWQSKGFYSLVHEFEFFVGNTPELVPIMQKLVNDGRIAHEYLQDLVVNTIAKNTVLNKKPAQPLFYSKQIESEQKILKTLFEELKSEQTTQKSPTQEELAILMNGPSMTERRRMNFNVNKLYNDIIDEIELAELRQNDDETEGANEPLRFDPRTSILYFNGKEIKISKTRDSDAHYLLCIIKKDFYKSWSYDEIWENKYFNDLEDDEYNPRRNWRKIYYAAYYINEKVAKKTAIEDFLDITKTAIMINKKYIK